MLARQLDRYRYLLGGTLFALLLTSWLLAVFHLIQANRDIEAAAEQRVEQNLAAFTSASYLSLALTDQALLHLQEIALNGKPEAFAEAGRLLSRPGVGGLVNRAALIGPDGVMHANFMNGADAPLLDVREREYFRTFLASPNNRLFISEPVRGKASRQWIVLFSRPLIRNGHFEGVVFAGFDADALTRLFHGFTDPAILISMLSPRGAIIARSDQSDRQLGKTIDLDTIPQAGKPVRDYVSPLDGEQRLSAVGEIANWGLQIYVGLPRAAISAKKWRQAFATLLPLLALSILLGGSAFIALRSLQRLEKAEDQARQAAQRSEYILGNMSESVLLLDHLARITSANAPAQQLLGDVTGSTIEAAFSASGLSMMNDDGTPLLVDNPIRLTCLEGGSHLESVWVSATAGKQTEPLWLALHAAPIREGGNGKITGAIVTLLERNDEHSRLNESAISRAILASMNDGLLITDPQGRIVTANDAFLRLLDWRRDELSGLDASSLPTAPGDHGALAAIWQQARSLGHANGHVRYQRRNGEEVSCAQTIDVVHDPHRNIIRYVCACHDVTEQEARERDLWRRANFDPLTELANRRRFDDRLTYALTQAERHRRPFVICYLDLDHFKEVNDRLGHAAGDTLLRQATGRMQAVLREEDTLARIGGDEFALIAPTAEGRDNAAQIIGKITEAIARVFDLPEGPVHIGISGGIALYPGDGDTANTLVAAADRALYAAKESGRNCFRFAADIPTEAATKVQSALSQNT
jgi:diguanylate cyclase (GGDEF)-like protein/PAS domain S-box-containing protein